MHIFDQQCTAIKWILLVFVSDESNYVSLKIERYKNIVTKAKLAEQRGFLLESARKSITKQH